MAETKMNERSSRSHSVLTIMVDGVNNVTGIRTHGCLHLIDLAGGLAGCCAWPLQQNNANRFSWAGSSTHSCLHLSAQQVACQVLYVSAAAGLHWLIALAD